MSKLGSGTAENTSSAVAVQEDELAALREQLALAEARVKELEEKLNDR